MEGVPPILWYLLVVAFFIWMMVGLSIQSRRDHRARMAEIEIQRIYAEKGVEPPGVFKTAAAGPQPHHVFKHGRGHGKLRSSKMFGKFSSDVFMAGIMAALAWWRIDEGGPQWAIYLTVVAAAMFGLGALVYLVAGIVAIAGESFSGDMGCAPEPPAQAPAADGDE
jgi:hypothetical protein